MPDWLISLFAHYGYFLVVAAVLLENAGVPAPGHTVMLAAGALAQQGQLSVVWVIITGATAAMVGDNLGYWIGRKGGRGFFEQHGKRLHLTPARIEAVDRFFARHGPKTVFIGRFITGLQTVVSLFAGVSRMPWWEFFLFNLVGAVAWAVTYGLLGYFFGASWTLLEHWVGHAGLFLLVTIALVFLVMLALRHRERIRAVVVAYTPFGLASRGGIIGVAVLGAIAAFAKIAEDVVNQESGAFDRSASLAVHRLDSPVMDALMRLFTMAASFPAAAVVVGATAFLCWRRHDRRALSSLLAVVAVNEGLNFVLKKAFARDRPSLFQEVATLHSYSFPSGHAMAAVAIYGIVAVVLAREYPRSRRLLAWLAPLFALLVGLSRIFLGVHWITDVLAAYAVGSAILLGGIFALAPEGRDRTG